MNGLIPSSQQRLPDPSPLSPLDWPNSATIATGFSIAVNIISKIGSFSILAKAAVNANARIWKLVIAFRQKDYVQVAFGIAAFIALFFPPYGWLLAISIDLTSECLNAYRYWVSRKRNDSPLFTRIDPNVRENALRILNLPVEAAIR